MCNSCSSGLNRREFISKSLKTSGALSLAMVGGASAMGTDFFGDNKGLHPQGGHLVKIKKEPARVNVVFLYPPYEAVSGQSFQSGDRIIRNDWFTYPCNQFEYEKQQELFTSKIRSIASKLGVAVDFTSKALYQRDEVDEFILKTKAKKPDAVMVVNFWNDFSDWSYMIATESAPAAIVYEPVGVKHQLPHSGLMNTRGIYYIGSIENWDEIERGLLAVRAKKMMAQSRLLRVTNQDQAMMENYDEFLNCHVVSVRAEEFNDIFDSIKPDNRLVNEAMKFKSNAIKVTDVEDKYFVDGMRAHSAVKQIMDRYGADAITINCLQLRHRKPCMSFAINNGNLIPNGCENHLDGTLTQMLGRWLLERAGFLHNPAYDTSENLYFGTHCTCAIKLQGPQGPDQEYLIRPFTHQLPKTPALDVQWTPCEPVMLVKYYSGRDRLICWTGKVIESPKYPPTGGCATRVLVELDKVDNVCDTYPGPHPILFWGNRSDARRMKAFSQIYGLDLEGNI